MAIVVAKGSVRVLFSLFDFSISRTSIASECFESFSLFLKYHILSTWMYKLNRDLITMRRYMSE
jgi:hypothetical protein